MKNKGYRMKGFYYFLSIVIYIIALFTSFFMANYLKNDKFVWQEFLRILTGNYFFDAFISFIFIIPICIIFFIIKMSLKKLLNYFFEIGYLKFLIYICTFITIIALISQIVYPILFFAFPLKFQYIRLSVGFAFLSFLFSVINIVVNKKNEISLIIFIGIILPFLLLIIIPWSLYINNISWLHFVD